MSPTKGLCRFLSCGRHQLLNIIDGVVEVSVNHFQWTNGHGAFKFHATTILELPSPGLTAIAGQTVTATGVEGRAWGYLIDA